MKDFILIFILSASFVAFLSGLLYLHIYTQRERIKQSYEKGLNEGLMYNKTQKKGYWKHCGPYIICSECNLWEKTEIKNYCPNCGADMRGDKNGGQRISII